MNVSIIAISQIQGMLSPAEINQAIHILSKRHPFLTSRLLKKSRLYYLETSNHALQVEVIQSSIQRRLFHLQEYINQSLDLDRPLVRFIAIYYEEGFSQTERDIDIITISSHAISDGISCANLHKELLTICNALSCKLRINLPHLPMLPPIESFIKDECAEIDKNEVLASLQKSVVAHDSKIPENIPENVFQEQTNIITLSKLTLSQLTLAEDLVKSIKQGCNKRRVSMLGALYAALLISYYEALNYQADEYFLCRASVNLRNLVRSKISSKHLFTAATGHLMNIPVTHEKKFWRIARKISTEMEKNRRNKFILKEHLCYSDLLDILPDIPVIFSVSNVGVVNIAAHFHQFKVLAFFLATNYKSKFIDVIFNTFHQKMICNIQYVPNQFSEGLIESIKNNMLKVLVCNNL